MILTGSAIKFHRDVKMVRIEPFKEENLNPNSYDLTLSPQMGVYTDLLLDLKKQPSFEEFTIPDEGVMLYPNKVYLACTVEECGSDHFVTCLEGRSSLGRMGVLVHLTAGFGDLGFKSRWTLEIAVIQPCRIYAGIKVCQAVFFDTLGKRDNLYKGKYVTQTGPVPSRIYKDFLPKGEQ